MHNFSRCGGVDLAKNESVKQMELIEGNLNKIKGKWDNLLKSGWIKFYPENNIEIDYDCNVHTMPLKLAYIPERSKRVAKKSTTCSFCTTDKIHYVIEYFGNVVLIPNKRPVQRYHSLLRSIDHIPQNSMDRKMILKATRIIEETEFRAFLNLVGTAATVDHFHVQTICDRFNVESLKIETVDGNLGFLPNYPGGNILIKGSPTKRCKILYEKIDKLTKSNLQPTKKVDGSFSNTPIYTILFWEDKILLIPRSKEVSKETGAMVGGLELSGFFVVTKVDSKDTPFEGYSAEKLYCALQQVTYKQNEVDFLLYEK